MSATPTIGGMQGLWHGFWQEDGQYKRAEKDCRNEILRGDFHEAGPKVSCLILSILKAWSVFV